MKSVVDEIVVIYIHVATCTVYVQAYAPTLSHMYTHFAHTFTYMNTHTHTHTHTRAHMQTRAYTHIHTHACTHTQVHELVYLLMYTHTNTLMPQASLLLPYQALASHSCTLDDSSSSLVSSSLTVSTMLKRENWTFFV